MLRDWLCSVFQYIEICWQEMIDYIIEYEDKAAHNTQNPLCEN